MRLGLTLFAGAALAAVMLPAAPADAVVLSIAGDADCFGLGGSCPDGTLWQDDLGGVFFTSNADASDPAGTDAWDSFDGPSYALGFAGGTAPLFIEIKTAGIADDFRGPYDVLLNGASIGQITNNMSQNAFQEVRTFSFAVNAAQLLANNTVLIGTPPGSGDGFSIDYVSLNGAAIPEPATWATMIFGFGLAGAALRRPRRRLARQIA